MKTTRKKYQVLVKASPHNGGWFFNRNPKDQRGLERYVSRSHYSCSLCLRHPSAVLCLWSEASDFVWEGPQRENVGFGWCCEGVMAAAPYRVDNTVRLRTSLSSATASLWTQASILPLWSQNHMGAEQDEATDLRGKPAFEDFPAYLPSLIVPLINLWHCLQALPLFST